MDHLQYYGLQSVSNEKMSKGFKQQYDLERLTSGKRSSGRLCWKSFKTPALVQVRNVTYIWVMVEIKGVNVIKRYLEIKHKNEIKGGLAGTRKY